VPGQSPQHFFQSVQKVKEQPFSRLALCLRPTGQVRLRQPKHRTTENDSFWEDVAFLVCVPSFSGRFPLFYIFTNLKQVKP
ncbi:hypothetical protein, partial [Cytobacillus sp.]|uniref:hypothetical protein n=1 Tax=Cytobacillus sp. TaxID=2675269 RepID=UPI003516CBD8